MLADYSFRFDVFSISSLLNVNFCLDEKSGYLHCTREFFINELYSLAK